MILKHFAAAAEGGFGGAYTLHGKAHGSVEIAIGRGETPSTEWNVSNTAPDPVCYFEDFFEDAVRGGRDPARIVSAVARP